MPFRAFADSRTPQMLRCIFVFAFPFVYLATFARGAEVSLSWDPNPEEDLAGYRVYFGTSSGSYGVPIDVGNAPIATVPALKPGTTYYFAVTAYNAFGMESLLSNEATFTVPGSVGNGGTLAGSFRGSRVSGPAGPNANLKLTVSKTGQFTGRIIIGKVALPVRGKLNLSGDTHAIVWLPNGLARILTLQRDPDTGVINATISDPSGEIQMRLARPAYSPESPVPVPQAGRYTMSIGPLEPSDDSPTHIPGGWGVGSLTVSKTGAVRAVGLLADGKPFAIASQLGETAEIPVYSMMYQGFKGVLAGNLRLAEATGTNDGDGTFWWQKPALTRAGLYSSGFNGTVRVQLSRWNRAVPEVFQQARLTATLTGGDLPALWNPIEKNILVLQKLLVLNPGFDQLKLRIDPATGLVHGAFRHPLNSEWRSIKGAILPKQGCALGFFRGIVRTGAFELGATEPE